MNGICVAAFALLFCVLVVAGAVMRIERRIARLESEKQQSSKRPNHQTRPVQVWVDVDIAIADAVLYLNTLPGVRTFASCQGTIGEGGSAPYRAQILASWPEDTIALIEKDFGIGERLNGCAYLHPRDSSI